MKKERRQLALVACSNGLSPSRQKELEQLQALLETYGVGVSLSPYLYQGETAWSGTAEERAAYMMDAYRHPDVTAICDLSGGDLANEILPFLDFETIGRHPKLFSGYSDLTTVLNAIYQKTQQPTLLYQVRHLVGQDEEQQQCFEAILTEQVETPVRVHMLQGDTLSGVVVGGNIRCFLKLAGTPYFPDCRQKVLLLESLSGKIDRLATYLAQLQQMGVFEQISGLLLGTFTELEEAGQWEAFVAILKERVPTSLSIGRTTDVGHGQNARPIWIGRELVIDNAD